MKSFWYKKSTKAIINFVQGILLCAMVIFAGVIWQLTEGNLTTSELRRSYENTGLFYRTVYDIVKDKVACIKNRELFESGGDTDLSKLIDIRQYASGVLDETSLNYSTSYTIEDLIGFASDGESLRLTARLCCSMQTPVTEEFPLNSFC